MRHRRARPTLRLLREDLVADWESPVPRRALRDNDIESLQPLFAAPHPLVRKAAESFTEDPRNDIHAGVIACVPEFRLLEVKMGQWRGAVWMDDDLLPWLIAGGLAKGNHEDHDDFYERLKRQHGDGALTELLPTQEDELLYKREVAAVLLTEVELQIQQEVAQVLDKLNFARPAQFSVMLPENRVIANVSIEMDQVEDDDDGAEEFTVEVAPKPRFAGTDLLWQVTTRVLTSLSPPVQSWDRFQNTYFTMAEAGYASHRAAELNRLKDRGELATSTLGSHAHYAHRRHLGDASVLGTAVRAMCGIYFVPMQDHETRPVCEACESGYMRLD